MCQRDQKRGPALLVGEIKIRTWATRPHNPLHRLTVPPCSYNPAAGLWLLGIRRRGGRRRFCFSRGRNRGLPFCRSFDRLFYPFFFLHPLTFWAWVLGSGGRGRPLSG